MKELDQYINQNNQNNFLLDMATILFYDGLNRYMKYFKSQGYTKDEVLRDFELFRLPEDFQDIENSTELVIKIKTALKDIESSDKKTKEILEKLSDLFGRNPHKSSDEAIKTFYHDLIQEKNPDYRSIFNELLKLDLENKYYSYRDDSLLELMTQLGIAGLNKSSIIYDPASGINSLIIEGLNQYGKNTVFAKAQDKKEEVLGYINLFLNRIRKEIQELNNSSSDLILTEGLFEQSLHEGESKEKEIIDIIQESLDLLSGTGKAFYLLPLKYLMDDSSRQFRKVLIENNYVESLFQLPENLIKNIDETPVLLVINKDKNDTRVRFINVSSIVSGTKRNPYFSKENIKEISETYLDEGAEKEWIRIIDRDRVIRENYNLSPRLYFYPDYTAEYPDWKYLEEVTEKVKSGNYIPSKDPYSDYNARVITKDDLKNSRIHKTDFLQEVSSVNINEELKINDILVLKDLKNFKALMYDPETSETVVADSNILVIRPDKGNINPYYLLAYLNSQEGRRQIESLGLKQYSLKHLEEEVLKKLIIPLKDFSTQESIGNTYKKYLEEKERTLKQLTEKEEEIGSVFDRTKNN